MKKIDPIVYNKNVNWENFRKLSSTDSFEFFFFGFYLKPFDGFKPFY